MWPSDQTTAAKEVKWNIATFSLKPGTTNVHCFFAAQQWMMREGKRVSSVCDRGAKWLRARGYKAQRYRKAS